MKVTPLITLITLLVTLHTSLNAQPLKPVSKDTVIKTAAYNGNNNRPDFEETRVTLWGYLDTLTGALALPYQYSHAEPFSEGWAYVWPLCPGKKSCPSMYIDIHGKKMLEAEKFPNEEYYDYYGFQHVFVNGLAIAYHAGKQRYGFINKKGKVVIPYKYNIIGSFSEGLAYASILGDSYPGYLQAGGGSTSDITGYIDTLGNWSFTLDTPYINRVNGCYYIGMPFKNGKAEMYTSERGADCADTYGSILVDRNGKVMLKPRD